MTNPDHDREFWERAALTALDAILLTEKDAMVVESASMAATAADHLLTHWRDRFGEGREP